MQDNLLDRSSDTAPVSTRAWVAVALACLGAGLLYALYWTPQGVDDAWITYRYAENLAAGNGFVYNLGERVLGTSTPLYTMVLAVGKLLGLPIPLAGRAIGAAAMIASIVLLFLLIRHLHGEIAGLFAAGLLASANFFHRVATFGMETPVYVALILGAFFAFAKGRGLLAAALAGLCLLTRLDGAAVGVALLLAHLLTRRTLPWKEALVYLAVIAPWFLFSFIYFDSLTPNSMEAKRLHTGYTVLGWMPRWLVLEPRTLFGVAGIVSVLMVRSLRAPAAAIALWVAMYAGAYTVIGIQRYDWYQTPLLAVLAGVAGIGVLEVARRPPVVALALWGAMYASIFALIGIYRYNWYQAPLLAVLACAAIISVVVVAARFARGVAWPLPVAIGLAVMMAAPDAYLAMRRAGGDEGILGVERLRYDAAVWMRDNLPPDAPIATGGIGLVGYYTGRHIYDAMGLVTPGSMRVDYEVANPRHVPFPRFLPAVIEDFEPEYVFDGFWLKEGQDMPGFMQGRYEVVQEWRSGHRGWPAFILYRRLAAPAKARE